MILFSIHKILSILFSILFFLTIILISLLSSWALRKTNLVTYNTIIPIMSSTIFLVTYPFYLSVYKHHKGCGLGEFKKRPFFTILVTIVFLQLILALNSQNNSQSCGGTINKVFIASAIAICLISPIYEEYIFRGVIFGALRNNIGLNNYTSAFLTSILFISLHWYYDNLSLFTLFIVSMLLSYLRVLTNGVLSPMLLHIIMNVAILTAKFFC